MIGASSGTIVVGLGGNVGTEDEIVERFRQAQLMFARLAPLYDDALVLAEVRAAMLYRTAPIGPAQAPFLNTAIAFDLPLDAGALMSAIREIEAHLGRDRGSEVRWGPRTIDLDVLLWDRRVLRTDELAVPHPRLHERRFALQPLVDLVGRDFDIPGIGFAGEALDRVRDQDVVLLPRELGEVRAMRVDE